MVKRLDALVCAELGVSREYAKQLIVAGKCMVAGKVETKPGAKIPANTPFVVDAAPPQFVSRGGLKLAKAINTFQLNLNDTFCMDIGASTGGFTDCMLQNGARGVFALDNGTSQLHPALLADPRVISLEGTDIRDVSAENLPFEPLFIAADLSFISLKLVIPKIAEILPKSGQAVLLIKPQFEVGRGKACKRGIVKSQSDHIAAIKGIRACLHSHELVSAGLVFSPITGQNGNKEYLIFATRSISNFIKDSMIKEVVEAAFLEL
ncbi:MAG: TlyA family RNA methyltransferase [Defluviitaleaceae bacterium]|nr:TlyA family RNA methyltransferase [Defluviitaleaceae bacterium]